MASACWFLLFVVVIVMARLVWFGWVLGVGGGVDDKRGGPCVVPKSQTNNNRKRTPSDETCTSA